MTFPDNWPGTAAPVEKGFLRGTHRWVDPIETISRIRHLMPALGITRVANITGLDTVGIPTISVYRPNSRSLVVAQGKGLDLAAAEASGLMEAIEHQHAERIMAPLKLASLRDLAAAHRVAELSGLLAPGGNLFHEDLRILWIEGWDLLGRETVWLPFECVHLDLTLPVLPGAGCFALSSNGLASGNHLLEAISHGLCELIERDSAARFRRLGADDRRCRRVDLATISDPSCRWALERFEAAGVEVAIWEITSGSRVPAFQCVVVDREDGWRSVGASSGMGCHPLPEIAILRALTEAAQSRLTSISGVRDDLKRRREEELRSLDVIDGVRKDLADEKPRRDFREVVGRSFTTFDAEVAWLLDQLRLQGARRVIVVDLTWPGLGIPVVRVVVPGLLGILPH